MMIQSRTLVDIPMDGSRLHRLQRRPFSLDRLASIACTHALSSILVQSVVTNLHLYTFRKDGLLTFRQSSAGQKTQKCNV